MLSSLNLRCASRCLNVQVLSLHGDVCPLLKTHTEPHSFLCVCARVCSCLVHRQSSRSNSRITRWGAAGAQIKQGAVSSCSGVCGIPKHVCRLCFGLWICVSNGKRMCVSERVCMCCRASFPPPNVQICNKGNS